MIIPHTCKWTPQQFKQRQQQNAALPSTGAPQKLKEGTFFGYACQESISFVYLYRQLTIGLNSELQEWKSNYEQLEHQLHELVQRESSKAQEIIIQLENQLKIKQQELTAKHHELSIKQQELTAKQQELTAKDSQYSIVAKKL